MGCEYYIFKVLHIYYNDTEYLDVTLHRKRGYYDYEEQDEDEADEDYNIRVNDYINYILTPKMKPVAIYNNCKFTSLSFETKYKHFVENEFNKYNKVWSDITKIIKVEERH
jgi:hypothetical protein